jgi:hypothetical protein
MRVSAKAFITASLTTQAESLRGLVTDHHMPPFRPRGRIRVTDRRQLFAIRCIERTEHQCDDRRIVNRADGSAALLAKRAAGFFGRAPRRGRATLPDPLHPLFRKLHPRKRERARVPLAQLARARVRPTCRAFRFKSNVAAETATLVRFICRHRKTLIVCGLVLRASGATRP